MLKDKIQSIPNPSTKLNESGLAHEVGEASGVKKGFKVASKVIAITVVQSKA